MIKIFNSHNSDVILAIFVVLVAAMLLIPLPPFLLDVLLAFNISFSILLLLVGLYIPNALALLAFPTLLLLTTLFRLSLNVSSTRLILLNGYAGKVIQAFGDFLIAGDPVIGAVIFIIIKIVNYIVITRGAGRVSEVSARFALDALPGKQMAIDSDLKTGTVSAEEASKKRDDLRKESQLYGAMDGAMKFVQGDALAGVLITVINIFGGLYIGVFRNQLSFSDAIANYTVLTVGDGLVSQIPALLISICAGIVVTRVSSGENITLGKDLASQLFQSHYLLITASFVVLLVGLLPNIPFIPFFITAFALFLISFSVKRKNKLVEKQIIRSENNFTNNLVNQDDVSDDDQEYIKFMLDTNYLFKSYQLTQLKFRSWYTDFKRDFYNHTGLLLPDIRVVSNQFLADYSFQVEGYNTILFKGELPADGVLLEMDEKNARALSFNVICADSFPLNHGTCCWCTSSNNVKKLLNSSDMNYYDPLQFIVFKMAEYFQNNPEEIISIVNVHTELKELQQKYPGLIQDSFNIDFINISKLTLIFQELVRERFNIKNFKQILGSIASYCSAYASSMVKEDDFDVHDIVSFIRTDRRRITLAPYITTRDTIRGVILSDEVKDFFSNGRFDEHGFLSLLDPQEVKKVENGIKSIVRSAMNSGYTPLVIVTPAELRYKILSFLWSRLPNVGVLSFDEIDSFIPIEKVAVWSI